MKTGSVTYLILFATLVLTVLFFTVSDFPDLPVLSPSRIARVDVVGEIYSSEAIIEQIEEYRRDDGVRAVVLRVDSPGGGVGPSQEIYAEVRRLREADKLVVVSMGSMAASGGYYVSCPGDWIFANPGTLTGSIGVIAEFANVSGLLDKVGVKMTPFKSGKLKDAGSPFREMDEEDRVYLQSLIDDTYRQFFDDVVRERQLNEDAKAFIRDGRVVIGTQAVKLGLVDEIGTMRDAIDYAADELDIPSPARLTERKSRRGLWDFVSNPAESLIPPALRNTWGFRLSYIYVP